MVRCLAYTSKPPLTTQSTAREKAYVVTAAPRQCHWYVLRDHKELTVPLQTHCPLSGYAFLHWWSSNAERWEDITEYGYDRMSKMLAQEQITKLDKKIPIYTVKQLQSNRTVWTLEASTFTASIYPFNGKYSHLSKYQVTQEAWTEIKYDSIFFF